MTARETVHTHGCLNCRPDMVPDFTRDDPRYHDGEKCGCWRHAWDGITVDGVPVAGYTKGTLEGPEGWVFFAGATTADVHACPCGARATCVEPRFGHVVVPAAPPIMRDMRDAIEWAPIPPAFTDTMARDELTAFVAEYETFWRWLRRQAP